MCVNAWKHRSSRSARSYKEPEICTGSRFLSSRCSCHQVQHHQQVTTTLKDTYRNWMLEHGTMNIRKVIMSEKTKKVAKSATFNDSLRKRVMFIHQSLDKLLPCVYWSRSSSLLLSFSHANKGQDLRATFDPVLGRNPTEILLERVSLSVLEARPTTPAKDPEISYGRGEDSWRSLCGTKRQHP